MNDFNSKAYTGRDFANIFFEKKSEDVETITIQLFRDGFSFNTILCDSTDTSYTMHSLASGNYEYVIMQMVDGHPFYSKDSFCIKSEDAEVMAIKKLEKQIEELYGLVNVISRKQRLF